MQLEIANEKSMTFLRLIKRKRRFLKYFFYKLLKLKGLSISNHHKCLS